MRAHGSPDWTHLVQQSARSNTRLRSEAPERPGFRIALSPRFLLYAVVFVGAIVFAATS